MVMLCSTSLQQEYFNSITTFNEFLTSNPTHCQEGLRRERRQIVNAINSTEKKTDRANWKKMRFTFQIYKKRLLFDCTMSIHYPSFLLSSSFHSSLITIRRKIWEWTQFWYERDADREKKRTIWNCEELEQIDKQSECNRQLCYDLVATIDLRWKVVKKVGIKIGKR